jgi:anti-sigma B factor antagonist
MGIHVRTVQGVTVVELAGRIDSETTPEIQEQIVPLVGPKGKILLDMTQVSYISSFGLRMLLITYRQVSSNQGQLALVGLSERIRDVMSLTGSLRFFATHKTLEAGLAAFK